MAIESKNYEGREQAEVKHYFLQQYLDALIHKVCSRYNHVAYVDGFSGPWQSVGENFKDTSFGIALASLRSAKAIWKKLNRDVKMSAYLVEKSPEAYAQLELLQPKFPDIEIKIYNGDFLQISNQIHSAIPSSAFTFHFIDPKGWRIDINGLKPLLSRPNSEVLFNFMFDFINRAASISDPAIKAGLAQLIPYGDWQEKLDALPTSNVSALRKDILVSAFCDSLKAIGKYRFVAEVPVLKTLKDRTLYSLVYATRHSAGIEVFRNSHVKTERRQTAVRAGAKQAARVAKTGQFELVGMSEQTAANEIDRYLESQRLAAAQMLINVTPAFPNQLRYDEIWPRVLEKHVVKKTELNQMAAALRKNGGLIFPTWENNKRIPADEYPVYRPN